MAIPDYQTGMLPLLKYASDGKEYLVLDAIAGQYQCFAWNHLTINQGEAVPMNPFPTFLRYLTYSASLLALATASITPAIADSRGFELFWDGKQVNGPETVSFTMDQAKQSCTQNLRPGIKVECRFNGNTFHMDP